ncbi:cytochrome P450 [Moorena sp. SIO4G3]|uniref:cytochrome P450 n=1 Tax=Moorena sp. SIO4G3 TaxID=2607821 RepID=UPI00142D0AF3|nr:cytochrome P450 [Moorena sp. SIO4G3]NEO79850.1 cytochrome P450 [Moorena sp. SIO4G3]
MSSIPTIIASSKAPLQWQNFRFYTNSYAYLDDLVRCYGETFMLPLGGSQSCPYVFFSNPQDIRAVHSLDYGEFVMENSLLKAIFGNGSMLLIDRDQHKRDRKLLSPPLRGGEIRALGSLVYQRTIKVFGEIETGEIFVASRVIRKILLYVIVEIVFGKQNDQLYEEMHCLFSKLLTLITFPGDSLIFFDLLRVNLGVWSPWKRLQQCRQEIESLLQREIDQRRQQKKLDSRDILSLMLSNSKQISDQELVDELFTLVIGGFESCESAIAWALYWIHKLPDVKEKLLSELKSLPRRADPMEICNLPFLGAICDETLRIHPVFEYASPRLATSSVKIGQNQFAAGTVLIPCIYLVHHRPDLYPEPKQFKPKRFLERRYDYSCEFIPFGGGKRYCLGYELVNLEMKLVLAAMLSHYSFQLVSHQTVKPRRRGYVITPSGGVRMTKVGIA